MSASSATLWQFCGLDQHCKENRHWLSTMNVAFSACFPAVSDRDPHTAQKIDWIEPVPRKTSLHARRSTH
eukprot:1147297-Prymnesium_polylepis.1